MKSLYHSESVGQREGIRSQSTQIASVQSTVFQRLVYYRLLSVWIQTLTTRVMTKIFLILELWLCHRNLIDAIHFVSVSLLNSWDVYLSLMIFSVPRHHARRWHEPHSPSTWRRLHSLAGYHPRRAETDCCLDERPEHHHNRKHRSYAGRPQRFELMSRNAFSESDNAAYVRQRSYDIHTQEQSVRQRYLSSDSVEYVRQQDCEGDSDCERLVAFNCWVLLLCVFCVRDIVICVCLSRYSVIFFVQTFLVRGGLLMSTGKMFKCFFIDQVATWLLPLIIGRGDRNVRVGTRVEVIS